MNANTNAAPRAYNTLLRKITPKTVAEKLGIDLLNLQRPVQPRHLYDLFGTVRDVTMVADKSGKGLDDSVRFRGKFQAVTQEGPEFDSAVTFIPVLDSLLFETFQEIRANNPDAVMEVALSVGLVPAPAGKPSATGYEFDVQRLGAMTASQPDDPIARLRAEAAAVRQGQAKLAAPDKGASTDADKAAQNGATEPNAATAGATDKATKHAKSSARAT